MSFRPPTAEPVTMTGPAGSLEGVLEQPDRFVGTAVICHPHPQHGGTMHNKVVHTLARALQEQGWITLRFNYRGVGASAGSYDSGVGETDDARAAVAWMRVRWPDAPLTLAGFSFGAVVALRAAAGSAPTRLITVAPAVDRVPVSTMVRPQCDWLLIQGGSDEIVDPAAVQAWARHFSPPPTLRLLPGIGHFFHGALPALKDAIQSGP